MKLKDGFILRQVAGEHVVLSVSANVDLNGMITLNDTGCTLWKRLESEATLPPPCRRSMRWTMPPLWLQPSVLWTN